ncbi:MFS transporter [Pseudoduganella sp. R-34]|uniref:MFS transporter n=1 Tax=unclassified Pseudoduganella TaxID=2637179 RepID=UPI003CFACA07
MASQLPPNTRLPASIWVLGLVSMLMDISSEMIHSLLPLFMVGTLGASGLAVGILEGLAEATALCVKVFSGALSDYLGKRKLLVACGYGLAALSKPLFAIAGSMPVVATARLLDRMGKGIRGAPRDAMLADLAPQSMRGAAFGLRQALDTVGACAGPLLASGLMLLWANDFRKVFWIAAIPASLSVLLLFVGVREPGAKHGRERVNPLRRDQLRQLDRQFWWLAALGVLFMLARFSEAFLVLRAQERGMALQQVPLVMGAMSFVYALSAYPFGQLADRLSGSRLLAIGLLVLVAADAVLASAKGWQGVIAGVLLWGLHMGMTQGLLSAMVANAAPAHLRGTAFGLFNLASGAALLASSAFAGWLWDCFGPAVTFGAGAVFALLALAVLPFLPRRPQSRA